VVPPPSPGFAAVLRGLLLPFASGLTPSEAVRTAAPVITRGRYGRRHRGALPGAPGAGPASGERGHPEQL